MGLTRYQIRIKLNKLYNDKAKYNKDLSDYKTSLTYANKIVSSLKNCKNHLNSSLDNLKKSFKINNKTADDGKIKEVINSIDTILNNLEKKVIPNINSSITNINESLRTVNYNITYWNNELKKAEE